MGACLDACAGFKTVVVDNASQDHTVSEVKQRPAVHLIENASNRGFAAAVNQAVATLDTELILLLNPDVELISSIEPLVEACRSPNIGIASGMLLDRDGQPQAGFHIRAFPTAWSLAFEVMGINRLWPRNRVNRHYRCLDMDLNRTAEVEQPAGAFLLFRRSLWTQLAGFDEYFFPVWFEDVDFCKRANDSGWKTQYDSRVQARHLGGHSISKLDWPLPRGLLVC